MAREGQKQKDQRLARRRIDALLGQISGMKPFNQGIADRYVSNAWKISTRNRIRLPLELRRSFCRKCKSYWKPGRTVRIRFAKGRKIYTCLVCRTIQRVPFK